MSWRDLMIRLGLRPDPAERLAQLPAVPPAQGRAPIVVSMTSISGRLSVVHRTVESILAGTLRPDRLVLHLSAEPHLADRGVRPEELPPPLRSLARDGLEISWVENTGPYRKLVPVWREMKHPEGVLVTADDDILYDAQWLERIYRYHLAHPRAIVCYRGFTMTGFGEGRLRPYMKWPRHRGEPPARDVFPTGKDGVLYPAGSLAEGVLDQEKFLALAPRADDVWLKAMSLLAQCDVKNITYHGDFPVIPGSEGPALFRQNRKDNDRVIRAVFSEYGLL